MKQTLTALGGATPANQLVDMPPSKLAFRQGLMRKGHLFDRAVPYKDWSEKHELNMGVQDEHFGGHAHEKGMTREEPRTRTKTQQVGFSHSSKATF